MSVREAVSTSDTKEITTDSSREEAIPKDIDLEKRKNIIREELRKLVGKPIAEKVFLEKQRLKQRDFDKKKTRRKLAHKSQKRNW